MNVFARETFGGQVVDFIDSAPCENASFAGFRALARALAKVFACETSAPQVHGFIGVARCDAPAHAAFTAAKPASSTLSARRKGACHGQA